MCLSFFLLSERATVWNERYPELSSDARASCESQLSAYHSQTQHKIYLTKNRWGSCVRSLLNSFLRQIQECNVAEVPIDCPERQLGGNVCYPVVPGEFKVIGKPIMINVSPDVVNVLGCMIVADGIVMGCSAFGALAGILSNGIKMFTTGCSGRLTWIQNKVSPPLAVSELGYMWVPLSGSWETPMLDKPGLFFRALQQKAAEGYRRL